MTTIQPTDGVNITVDSTDLTTDGPLQSAEAPTFEKHINGAGLRCGKAEGATITESELNQWHGVKWLIGEAASQNKADESAPVQGSLL